MVSSNKRIDLQYAFKRLCFLIKIINYSFSVGKHLYYSTLTGENREFTQNQIINDKLIND